MLINYFMVGGVSMLTGIVIGLYLALGKIREQSRIIDESRFEAEQLAKCHEPFQH